MEDGDEERSLAKPLAILGAAKRTIYPSLGAARFPKGENEQSRGDVEGGAKIGEKGTQEVVFMGEDGIMEVKTTAGPSSTKGAAPRLQYAFYRPPTKRLYRKLEGWLWKKGANSVISGWKRRYFYLKDNRLYYSTDPQAEPINYILLTAAAAIEAPLHPDPRFPHSFHLRTTCTKRVYVLAVEDAEDVERWVGGVREVIKLLADRYSLHKDFIKQYILPPDEPQEASSTASSSAAPSLAKSERGRPKSTPAPLLGPSSARPVVDLLITHAHLNTNHKLAHAAGRAGLYLELSLGRQSLRTWSYHHSKADVGHAESSREVRRTENHYDRHSPATSPHIRNLSSARSNTSPPASPPSLSSFMPSPLLSSSSSASFPWAGLGCTFTEEGSGEDIMEGAGCVKVALWQIGGLGSADTLVDEQWIDLATIPMDKADEVTLAFSFSFAVSPLSDLGPRSNKSQSSGNLSPRNHYHPSKSMMKVSAPLKAEPAKKQSEWTKARVSPASQNGYRSLSPVHGAAEGNNPQPKPNPRPAVETTLANNWKTEVLGTLAVADFATRGIEQEEKELEEDEREEERERETMSSPSQRNGQRSTEDAPCTVTIKVQKSPRSFDKSALLQDRGIASTSIPMRLDTGDIVLFDNSHILAYGTKFFTMSHWDHVAMVVRWWNNEIRLLEATLEGGVEMYNFDDRIELLRTVSKVAIRQLSVQRTPEMMDAIYRFIDEVQGRPFQKNRLSMVKAWSGLNTEEDFSSLFCSELTAAAYKRMGLVRDSSKSSNNYMPSCWAGKGRTEDTRIPLKPSVRLERKVVFPITK